MALNTERGHMHNRIAKGSLLLGIGLVVALGVPKSVAAGDDESGALGAKLKASKHTLLEGIAASQKENGVAISAKLEVEDGKLWLSVYTAKAGLGADAEHNVLMELKGDATTATWEPKTEIFEDKPHLARSAMHLTAMQTTPLTLEAVIKVAAAKKKGSVYSVIPAVRDGKTVFDVLVRTPAGKTEHLTIDETTK
jgi:hypothetical protein